MKWSVQLRGLLVAFSAWLVPLGLRADPPDTIGSYRLAPQVSTIAYTANPENELNVYGTFDFIQGWQYIGDPPRSIVRYADFANVDAWAQNPLSAAPPISVDSIFNLSGLVGEQLPVASIFDVYKFDGKNLQGDQVELFVSVLGEWLYLRGQTEQVNRPEMGWRMNAFAHRRPFADFDETGKVDAADLTALTNRFGAWTGMNDADGDDFQTGADFLHWQRQLGQAPPDPPSFDAAINAALAPAATSIPEPATTTLLAAALFSAIIASRLSRSPQR